MEWQCSGDCLLEKLEEACAQWHWIVLDLPCLAGRQVVSGTIHVLFLAANGSR